MTSKPDDARDPGSIGVVVIGRNEGERLVRCLRSVVSVTDRVVYVDSGSTDNSVDEAKRLGVDVIGLSSDLPFTAARARNCGFTRLISRWPDTRFVQMVDGDCEMCGGWIGEAGRFLSDRAEYVAVCGRLIERHSDASIYNRLAQLEWDGPVGDVAACGGIAMYRAGAFAAAGGFRESMIAGEEPELCVRLRSAGGRVHRLPADMALHDIAMTRFSQFWKRAKRAGHAYAEGAALHGRGPDRHGVRAVRSALVWGLGLPVVAVVLAYPTYGVSLVGWLMLFAVQIWRVQGKERARGRSGADARLVGFAVMIAKFAQVSGIFLYWRRRLMGQRSLLIEYKGDARGGGSSRRGGRMGEPLVILYMSGTLPTRSETFVYREIFALRSLGLDVRTASVHAPVRGLDSGPLDEMARESISVYGRGLIGLLADAAVELVSRPWRTVSTLGRVLRDAVCSSDVTMERRPKIIWQGLAGVSLARRARGQGIGHIHAHMAHVPTTIAMYAAMQLGVGFSFTGHANDLFPNRTLLQEKLRRAMWVNCISEWHRGFYQSIVPRAEADYPVVRCGVDTEMYEVTIPPRREGLEVLAVGRLVEKKGFDVLVDALGDISKVGGPPIRARIAGGGEELENLRRLIAEQPEGTLVELLGDTPNDRVMELMGEADLFVIPCRVAGSGDRDGIPVVLMEAMARGRCVVSGDLETIRELVRDGVTGVMVPPGDRSALARVLTELALDRDRVDELGRAGRARVEQEFDLRVNARRIIRVMRAHGLAVGLAMGPAMGEAEQEVA